MQEDKLKGKWNQLKSDIQKEWKKLNDHDIDLLQVELTRLKEALEEKQKHSNR